MEDVPFRATSTAKSHQQGLEAADDSASGDPEALSLDELAQLLPPDRRARCHSCGWIGPCLPFRATLGFGLRCGECGKENCVSLNLPESPRNWRSLFLSQVLLQEHSASETPTGLINLDPLSRQTDVRPADLDRQLRVDLIDSGAYMEATDVVFQGCEVGTTTTPSGGSVGHRTCSQPIVFSLLGPNEHPAIPRPGEDHRDPPNGLDTSGHGAPSRIGHRSPGRGRPKPAVEPRGTPNRSDALLHRQRHGPGEALGSCSHSSPAAAGAQRLRRQL